MVDHTKSSPTPTPKSAPHAHHLNNGFLGLCLGALGVVYGDIGTSPLYALNFMFFGHGGVPLSPDNIVGGISLVVWALTLVVAIKYAILVLRADNDGEGGVFALYGLLDKFNHGKFKILSWTLLIGAGLLFGDGTITPAISVLSAVEGIAVATPVPPHETVLLTLLILTALFAFQKKGTHGIGRIFGPVLIVWFLVIGWLGLRQVVQHEAILRAFNPWYAIAFLHHSEFKNALFVIGALMLVLTGGEAMYADMGHLGAKPIRTSLFVLVYPALLLNYLGQGAFLLGGGVRLGGNLFYSMVPLEWLFPMVVLATLATVIASQALISGAFSLTAQAIGLGLLPRLKVVHTHSSHFGQVYVPFINWVLYLGCALLVVFFGSSEALGSAYGLAESGVMLTTSGAMYFVARRYWGWSVLSSAAVFGSLALIDGVFLGANTFKLMEGGYIPLLVGFAVFVVMLTWKWGRKQTFAGYGASKHLWSMGDLFREHAKAEHFIERVSILMVPERARTDQDNVPMLMQMLWARNGVLPRNIIFLQVQHPKEPYVNDGRYSVQVLRRDDRGSILRVQVNFGFMEDPNVEQVLHEMMVHEEIDLPADRRQWHIHVAVENLLPSKAMRPIRRLQLKFFSILRNISRPAYYHYGLGDRVQLSAQIFPIIMR